MNQNLPEVLGYWARWQPEKTAVHCAGEEYTWRELDLRTDVLAGGLSARGVGPGDVVAILAVNCLEFVEVLFAALKLGAVVAPLNIRWTGRELAHPLRDSAAKVLLTEERFAGRVHEALSTLPDLLVVTRDGGDGFTPLDALRDGRTPPPAVDVAPDATAFMVYTSGTTGFPKGVLISHSNVIYAGIAKVVPNGLTPDDRLLVTNPLAYTSGCLTKFLQTGFMAGAASYLVDEFDAESTLEQIERHRITTMSSVPVIVERMMASPSFGVRDLSCLKKIWVGGAPVPPSLLAAWHDRGIPLVQAYGLTEVSGACVLSLHAGEAGSKAGFAGRAMLFHSVRIARPDGSTAEPGEVGQILIKGPAVMKGYHGLPEESRAALAGGWLHTGDLGLRDDEGYIKIVDRSGDMLISGGLNVYPAEIERALAGLSGVEELAVIGVSDPRWGQVPLMVVPDAARVDRDALVLRCRSALADYKRPSAVVGFGGPLPRTLSGKIEKNLLRQRFKDVPSDAVRL